ncbi:hypothetical protein GN956_G7642 [Arapaima gigas]
MTKVQPRRNTWLETTSATAIHYTLLQSTELCQRSGLLAGGSLCHSSARFPEGLGEGSAEDGPATEGVTSSCKRD